MKIYSKIPDVPSILKEIEEHGVIICKNAVNEAQLNVLNKEFEFVHQNNNMDGIEQIPLEVGRGAKVAPYHKVADSLPSLKTYFLQDWMQQVSDGYWHQQEKVNSLVYVMHDIVGTTHLAQDLHFDVQETLKFFLYLNDVTKENGAFSCVPGSHRYTKQVRSENSDDITYENLEYSRDHPYSEEQIVPVEAKAGTLIIFTTECWHRAGLVSKGERKVMRGHTRVVAERFKKQGLKSKFFKLFASR